jgi:hypothetical protein
LIVKIILSTGGVGVGGLTGTEVPAIGVSVGVTVGIVVEVAGVGGINSGVFGAGI